MYRTQTSNSFRKSYKKLKPKDKEELKKVVALIESNQELPEKYKNHFLTGNFKDCQECHVRPDLLLIYQKKQKELILYLIELGSHSKLFGK